MYSVRINIHKNMNGSRNDVQLSMGDSAFDDVRVLDRDQ